MSKQKQTTGTFLTDGVWTGLWAPVRYHLETQSLLLAVEVQRLQGLQHTNSTHAQKTRNLQASRLQCPLVHPGVGPFASIARSGTLRTAKFGLWRLGGYWTLGFPSVWEGSVFVKQIHLLRWGFINVSHMILYIYTIYTYDQN